MQLYSENFQKIVSNIDIRFFNLEQNLIDKNIEIVNLKNEIQELHDKNIDQIKSNFSNIVNNLFSDKIELDGLGVSGARLLKELRQLDKIEDMNKFLTQFGLNK
jgi:hypothetical protein